MRRIAPCRAMWFSLAVILLSIVGTFSVLFGCAGDNSVSVGKLSMTYPSTFSIREEGAGMSLDLPEGMASINGILLVNDDYSMLLELAEVNDPDSLGLAAIDELWRHRIADPRDESTIESLESNMPGLRSLLDDTTIDQPQMTVIDECRVVSVSLNMKHVRKIFYYFEFEGKVVGAACGILPQATYEENPRYYNDIFLSVKIAK